MEKVIISTSDNVCGAVVYWSLSGLVSVSDLAEKLSANGLQASSTPKPASASANLQRVCQGLSGAQKGRLLDKKNGSYIFVASNRSEDTYSADLVVSVGVDNELRFSDDSHALAGEIRKNFESCKGKIDTIEMSKWLGTFLMGECAGVRLRPSGGMYYVPSTKLELFQKVVAGLSEISSHQVFEIPAVSSSETAAAVLECLREDCQAVAADVMTSLEKETSRRSTYSRQVQYKRLSKQSEKLAAYESLLGARTKELQSILEDSRLALLEGMTCL